MLKRLLCRVLGHHWRLTWRDATEVDCPDTWECRCRWCDTWFFLSPPHPIRDCPICTRRLNVTTVYRGAAGQATEPWNVGVCAECRVRVEWPEEGA